MDVAHLRPFGTIGWGTVVNKTAGKLDPQAFKGRLVGYGSGRGVYLLYTSDMDFEEKVLPVLPPAREEGRYDQDNGLFFPTNTSEDVDNKSSGDDKSAEINTGSQTAEFESEATNQPIQPVLQMQDNVVQPTAQSQTQPCQSTRPRNPLSRATEASKSTSRENGAQRSREEWAMNRKPRANITSFAILTRYLPNEAYQSS
ncbi:hypothetical protein J3R30DRAFT_3621818 [Lentinula aciculospora]|uniref:Uncharacterized protein n=1 Tax=Lentinula aciculospora TaxID=153920 RepID=A0A9W8ZSP3_9AGAR|nr:hypothetical protein J3R30DRAFT_3621818 [Lentinula aciculospora]